jgi:hypothetical protein
MKRYLKFAFENSIFLIVGTLAGLVWANLGPLSYAAFRDVQVIPASWVSLLLGSSQYGVGLHYLHDLRVMS